jgi:L-cysteine:1D-myo-inositol 2-amino-2-deoxy-alpha-D-glucopyranoside ligase
MDSWRRVDVPRLPGSGPAPRLHDTATGQQVPAAAGPVATLYACGITPYDATHIGHAATFTAWDLFVRACLDAAPETPEAPPEAAGTRPQAPGTRPQAPGTRPQAAGTRPQAAGTRPEAAGTRPQAPGTRIASAEPLAAEPSRLAVVYVQNVTDVDDPLLERAARDGEDWCELASREIQRYRRDMEALRILPPTYLIGAIEALPVIERFAGLMADRGALYEVDEDVYFAKSADPAFGALSGPGTPCRLGPAEMAQLAAQRGGDPGRPGKKDPLDCLVWRAERPGEPAWDSRFGRGRPGWHVECAAIATEFLGAAFDVQAGGSDLVFPHHEMSASHARVAFARTGGVFARVYAHAGMVSYRGEKMSKSLGNLVFVSSLLGGGADPMAVRMALLAHHYRSDWEWTEAVLAEAAARLARWRSALARAEAAVPYAVSGASVAADFRREAQFGGPGTGPVSPAQAVLAGVRARLRDDLDAPGALGIVDHWADSMLAAAPLRITPRDASAARLVSDTVDALLGIRL